MQCQGCGRTVVPQLWVTDHGELTVPKVRHLCPLCGETPRVTGGGLTRGGLYFFVGMAALIMLGCALLLVLTG